jgi:hypothetical protein
LFFFSSPLKYNWNLSAQTMLDEMAAGGPGTQNWMEQALTKTDACLNYTGNMRNC